MNGARPASEVVTRGRGVKAECEDADATGCVLLLPGTMRKNEAGTGVMAVTEAARAGAHDDGEICAVQDRAADTWRAGAKAHLTSGISGERSESAACRG